ncbi:MAG: L-amino acid N-acyltransferase YncA [Parvicella sp.]|jgi:phosphinothricin acetyltransferase|uniref:GNAT family N-acetyltransferase n=1 Tax=Flavobacteriaceae TaxID=49546 RepID=UPI000C7B0E06|nr:GNAT family N-acetyltransferase [Psychroflexus sp. MES1-P1E]PKG43673.1 N-acetyltransferase [Psychroflexus sp. MES1-P1E]|tara:strand:+ start:3476 stop:3979 length:504 start_codon:yes stop_codon:yes gene_type:complete
MEAKLTFRNLKETDWEQVSGIYQEGLDTGNATFESNLPNWEGWNNGHLKECRLIAEINNKIVGWYALSPVSSRCVYGGVAEVSVYVSTKFSGQKIGTELLGRLITESENNEIWTLQAGIFPENKGSLIIHERLGFRKVGYREKIGKMNGVWRNTILLERRSNIIGVE